MKLALEQITVFFLSLIRERRRRRNLMFYVCLGSLGLVGIGSFAVPRWLEDHPLIFLVYWGLTGFAVLLMMLLAVYDMLQTWKEGGG